MKDLLILGRSAVTVMFSEPRGPSYGLKCLFTTQRHYRQIRRQIEAHRRDSRIWRLFHMKIRLVVPIGSTLDLSIGSDGSSIRFPDREIRTVENISSPIFPIFFPHERYHHFKTIGADGNIF